MKRVEQQEARRKGRRLTKGFPFTPDLLCSGRRSYRYVAIHRMAPRIPGTAAITGMQRLRAGVVAFFQDTTPRPGYTPRMHAASVMVVPMVLAFQPASAIKDVAWIAGCWETTRNGRHVVENWTAPEGGTMMGVSRTVDNGTTKEWEFLIIRQGASALGEHGQHSAQP